MNSISLSRRDLLRSAIAASVGLALAPLTPSIAQPTAQQSPITKPIPSSGEKLPVIGLGTNQFSVEGAEEKARLQAVLENMIEQGGSVVDTARVYGRAEEVIGELMQRIDQRRRFFIATKMPIRGEIRAAEVELQEAFDRLQVETIDLMLIHNLHGLDAFMPALLRAREDGRIRYVGMSTSTDTQYAAQMDGMRRYPLDFIQVDYSLANRGAADEIIPLAMQRRMAVMVNLPFGGRQADQNLFAKVAGRPLPEWAADIDAESWGQIFLKYLVSHPGVNVAIPGTTKVNHLLDNQAAGRGRLPDQAMRREMERYWDAL